MSTERRHRTVSERDSYTSIQQHKRSRSSRPDGKMSDRHCTSLIPSAADDKSSSPTTTPWKGWKPAPAKATLRSLGENSEFPPLAKDEHLDAWYTPQPIKNWADFMDEEESALQENVKPKANVGNKKQRFKRKLCLSESGGKTSPREKSKKPILTDEHRLAQRQKQIDYGKNTASYGRYIAEIPRQCRDTKDPRTPDKFQICSTRSWDGQIRSWRRKLHDWDLPVEGKVNPFSLVSNSVPLSDIEMHFDQLGSSGSASSTNSSQEFFADLNIDKCLLEDGLPL